MQHAEHSLDGAVAPAPMPPATVWEWSAMIAVALDGEPRRPRAGTLASLTTDRTAKAVIALLVVAAAVLSALLM